MHQEEKSKKEQREFIRGLQVLPLIGSPKEGKKLSGFTIIRLNIEASTFQRDNIAETLVAHAKINELKGLYQVLESAGLPDSHRLVTSVPPEKILDMEREASRTKYPPLHSLTQYWRLDLRKSTREEIEKLIKLLSTLPEVDSIWEESLSTLPIVTPGDDPYNSNQNYQDAAPDGIDARWMWTQANGEGAGIDIVDVEGGWRITHEDLSGKSPMLIHGNQYNSWEDHGTAVLGEILAIDNTVGVVGTAPSINSIRLSSIYDSSGTQNVTNALTAAVAAISVGQILLIELQTNFLPEETEDDRLDVIRLATARGIIVIEAAGNGQTDLDNWSTPISLIHRLNRNSADFVDSGAIMVGASESALPHNRWKYSNFGSRIDCFAWGENVVTLGYGDLDNGGGDADKWYTDTFQGTSSASPIIVSAAALIQSHYQAMTGTLLSPGQMRTLLANPATGTAQGTLTNLGAIGVMPNLAAIIPSLGLLPDIYLRDAVGDTGVIPWAGSISISPDIIVCSSSVNNPQQTFGEGSGTENLMFGDPIEAGQDSYIYVRVRNRGGAAANNVVATIYWSEVATLVTPSMWHLIGSITLPQVPVGDVLTVSPVLIWPKADIPGEGHYCFVATLQHVNDPSPPIPSSMSWNDFCDLIRAHNNVTWKNFNVQNDLPTIGVTPFFRFKLVGADDHVLRFTFEVERRLPADTILELEGPLWLLEHLKGEKPWKINYEKQHEKTNLILPNLPRIMLNEISVPRGVRLNCALKVLPGKEKVEYGHGVAIRQIFKGNEVGRINWRFAPKTSLHINIKK